VAFDYQFNNIIGCKGLENTNKLDIQVRVPLK
jgi:hypothetical protein